LPRISHSARRGAVYYFRIRIPRSLTERLRQSHFVLSLETKEQPEARRLAAHLHARTDAIFEAILAEPSSGLDQLRARFKETLARCALALGRTEHAETMPAVSGKGAIAASFGVSRAVSENGAFPGPRDWLLRATFGELFVGEFYWTTPQSYYVAKASGSISPSEGLPSPHHATSAQCRRHFTRFKKPGQTDFRREPLLAFRASQTRIRWNSKRIRKATSIAPVLSDLPNETFHIVADDLIRRRTKDRSWDVKTARQARQIYLLFARFVREVHRIELLSQLRQRHLATFTNFLQFEIHTHHGKSAHDEQRTIAELITIAQSKPHELCGLQGPTLNRHLTFLQQLLQFATSQGIVIDRDLSTKSLRVRAPKDRRDRHARAPMTTAQAEALFRAPSFTGCAAWDRPLNPELRCSIGRCIGCRCSSTTAMREGKRFAAFLSVTSSARTMCPIYVSAQT
jgi:hypothetical protein